LETVIAGFGPRGELPSPLPLSLSLSSPPPPLYSSLRAPFFSPARDPARPPRACASLRAAPSRRPRAACGPLLAPLARRAAPPQPPRAASWPPPRPPVVARGPSRPLAPRAWLHGAPARGPCPRAAWSPVRPLTPGSAAPRGSPSAFSRAWRSNLGLISF
jgi:hypothetical protein